MTKYDVTGVGNAIVDILAKVDYMFLDQHKLARASMTLIDEKQAKSIYDAMPPAIEKSGGSAANTMAGIASFGGKAAFIGKVKNDELGQVFGHDLRSIGVHYETKAAENGVSTAKCLISITPDAERTMATYLGATREISVNDIDEQLIANSKIIYLEGYLWDEQHAKDAMRMAAELAQKHKRKVALSLSDAFCVDRHREGFLELIKAGVDIVFANEVEIKSLMQVDDFEAAVKKARGLAEIIVITRGSYGSIILNGEKTEKVESQPNLKVVDTTGAGDLYASGFLYGYANNLPLGECGRLATIAASEVIQHVGARPEVNLAELAKAA